MIHGINSRLHNLWKQIRRLRVKLTSGSPTVDDCSLVNIMQWWEWNKLRLEGWNQLFVSPQRADIFDITRKLVGITLTHIISWRHRHESASGIWQNTFCAWRKCFIHSSSVFPLYISNLCLHGIEVDIVDAIHVLWESLRYSSSHSALFITTLFIVP